MLNIELNLELLIKHYSNYLLKVISNITTEDISYQDKEEIISQAFFLLWKNSKNIKTNPKSYLATTVKNLTYDYLCKKKIVYEYEDNMINSTSDIDKVLIIEEQLKKLSVEEKKIFVLFYVDGYKVKEIGKIIQKKPTAVKVLLHRIRKKLKEEN